MTNRIAESDLMNAVQTTQRDVDHLELTELRANPPLWGELK